MAFNIIQKLCIALVLAAIFECHETLIAEARKLKVSKHHELIVAKNNQKSKASVHVTAKMSSNNVNIARKKGVLPSAMPVQGAGFGNSDVEYTYVLKSTSPGNSPGIGHRSSPQLEDNLKAKKLGVNAPSVIYPNAGSEDGLRPTTPGHSPGVGHSFSNGNLGLKA